MKSQVFLKILAVVIYSLKILISDALRFCPNYCICNIYEGRNRADCSKQRLINPYVDLSAAVEVLDLSYNDIAIIDDNCFENYYYLINLTIAHNDIHTIYLDAFVELRRLSAVDFSYNRLEYLDERLFEANRHLHELNLEGNRFSTLPSRPLLRSISLRTLNLRNSGINYIRPELWTALPQLAELDLSQNLMITLNAALFNAAKHLKSLLLDENPWICDNSMVKALSIMRHRGINVSMPECDVEYHEWQKQLPIRTDGKNGSSNHGQIRTFERMRLHMEEVYAKNETNNSSSQNHVNDSDDGDNKTLESTKVLNWRNLSSESEYSDDTANYDNENRVSNFAADVTYNRNNNYDDDNDDIIDFANFIGDKQTSRTRLSLLGVKVDEKLCEGTRENLCRHYRDCLGQVSHDLIKKMQKLNDNDKTYTETEMFLAFMFGIVIGISFVVFLFTCVLLLKGNCSKLKKSRPLHDLEDIYDTLPYTTHMPTNTMETVLPVTPATPVASFPTRRSRRPRRPPVRMPIENAIIHRDHNQSSDSFISRLLGRTARHQYYRARDTLIRSLSRTSLFNGNAQRDQNRVPIMPENELTNPNLESAPINRVRSETPPPNYGDIIIKK